MSLNSVHYRSSIYNLINFQNGEVGVGATNPNPVFRTTQEGLELGKKLVFQNRPLGIGAETEVIKGRDTFTLNQNIPASYIHVNDPPGAWVVAIDGSNDDTYTYQNDLVRDITVSANGNVYSTLEFDGNFYTIFRNPDGSSITIPDLGNSNINNYAMISCHSPGGVPQWNRIIATSNETGGGYIYAPSIKVDAQENTYVVGRTESIVSIYTSNVSNVWSSPPNDHDGSCGFIFKLDDKGDLSWASTLTTTTSSSAWIYSHTLDVSSNALFVAGLCTVSESGEPLVIQNTNGSTTSVPITSVYQSEYNTYPAFIGKFDENGELLWMNVVDSIGSDSIVHVEADTKHNVIFATHLEDGSLSNVVMYSQDSNNITFEGYDSYGVGSLVGKYDSYGNAVWGVYLTDILAVHAIKVNENNDIFVVVEMGSANFYINNADGTPYTIVNPSAGTGQLCNFILRFNENGIYQSHTNITNVTAVQNSYYSDIYSCGFSLDSSGNMYMSVYGSRDEPLIIYNPDGSTNTVEFDSVSDVTSIYHSTILKFDAHGNFIDKIAHLDGNVDAIIYNMALDEPRRRLYVGAYGQDHDFVISNRYGSNVYAFSNIDYLAGFIVGLNMDNGDVVSPGRLVLPAHESDSFTKDIYVTSLHPAPFTTYLEVENRDHTYKFMPITLEQSNVTVQKSLRWTSNSWVLASQFEPTANGVNLVSYYYGDQEFDVSSSNYIGATIAWQNKTKDNKLAFRVTTKCSLASDEEIAYRQFEALVSPIDNETSNMPYGIVSAEVGDTFGTVFTNLDHTITRHSDRSIDLKVGWDTNSSNYVGNIELHVLATTRLGDITFSPIHG